MELAGEAIAGLVQCKIILPKIVAIAEKAGQAIMAVYSDAVVEVMHKQDSSPLTQADLAADKVIAVGLAELDLDWPVLSEESAKITYGDRKHWRHFWLIDPLDGTKEFINRNGEFTVNIALIENGQPILGVVYAPALDVCYFAAQGVGAFVRRGTEEVQSLSVKSRVCGETITVVASRSHCNARTEALLKKLDNCLRISMGSSLKLCLIAEGRANFYPRLGPTMEWDTAAAHAVVKFSGGVVCDSSGVELSYNKADLHNPEFFVMAQSDELLRSLVSEK